MTIAVIGHGRSPEGQGWGSQIDRCSTVVRLWDWIGWQPLLDYGEKYTFGLFVLTPKGLQIFMEYNNAFPRLGWLAYLGKPTPGRLPTSASLELVDPAPWVSLARGMGGTGLNGKLTLTRGCVAAAWAITMAARSAPRERVILVGFDNVQCGINQPVEQSFCPAYWEQYLSRFKPDTTKTYPIGTAKTATHDMNIELPLLKHLAEQHRVDLKFAQEVWRD